jgi:hypothetical protein
MKPTHAASWFCVWLIFVGAESSASQSLFGKGGCVPT